MSIELPLPIHEAQLLSYLKSTDFPAGQLDQVQGKASALSRMASKDLLRPSTVNLRRLCP